MNRTSLLLLGLLPALLVAVPRVDVPAAGEGPVLRIAALDVGAGERIDLATGALVSGPNGHLEAGRGPGGALVLRPLEGAVLSPVQRGPAAAAAGSKDRAAAAGVTSCVSASVAETSQLSR